MCFRYNLAIGRLPGADKVKLVTVIALLDRMVLAEFIPVLTLIGSQDSRTCTEGADVIESGKYG